LRKDKREFGRQMKLPKEDHNGLLNNIGCCLIELKRYKEARVCLVEALEVKTAV